MSEQVSGQGDSRSWINDLRRATQKHTHKHAHPRGKNDNSGIYCYHSTSTSRLFNGWYIKTFAHKLFVRRGFRYYVYCDDVCVFICVYLCMVCYVRLPICMYLPDSQRVFRNLCDLWILIRVQIQDICVVYIRWTHPKTHTHTHNKVYDTISCCAAMMMTITVVRSHRLQCQIQYIYRWCGHCLSFTNLYHLFQWYCTVRGTHTDIVWRFVNTKIYNYTRSIHSIHTIVYYTTVMQKIEMVWSQNHHRCPVLFPLWLRRCLPSLSLLFALNLNIHHSEAPRKRI